MCAHIFTSLLIARIIVNRLHLALRSVCRAGLHLTARTERADLLTMASDERYKAVELRTAVAQLQSVLVTKVLRMCQLRVPDCVISAVQVRSRQGALPLFAFNDRDAHAFSLHGFGPNVIMTLHSCRLCDREPPVYVSPWTCICCRSQPRYKRQARTLYASNVCRPLHH